MEVNYTITSEGHDNPAIEGEDFTVISAGSLAYPQGWGYDSIKIQTIDNNVFTGTKSFSIILSSNSQSYEFDLMRLY